jgi:hypothetical protein
MFKGGAMLILAKVLASSEINRLFGREDDRAAAIKAMICKVVGSFK